MGAFRSVLKAFRAALKPGITNINTAQLITQNASLVADSENADPTADQLGNQWVRNWDFPLVFNDWGNENSPTVWGVLGRQKWIYAVNDTDINIGTLAGWGATANLALMRAVVMAGDPAVAWSAAPVYFQLWRGGVVGGVGSTLLFSAPVPVVPSALTLDFSIPNPVNFINGNGENSFAAFSSTRDTFTAGPTGSMNLCVAAWYRE